MNTRPPEACQACGAHSLGYTGGRVIGSFKVPLSKEWENFPAYFMMDTVVYTNTSAEIAGAEVEILRGGVESTVCN